MYDSWFTELLSLHAVVKPCKLYKAVEAKRLSRFDYATARAAGFDMSQFSIEPARYVRS